MVHPLLGLSFLFCLESASLAVSGFTGLTPPPCLTFIGSSRATQMGPAA